MADNYLITGYWGEPHVTAENDRGINAAVFGTGRFVLPVGEQFKAEYIGNNTIRMYDGKLMDNGAAAGIPAGEYIDLLIPETGQGMNRNDLIVFQYSQDASTLIESGVFTVIHGAEASDTASDPELTHEDLLSGEATFDQMALWRVSVSGAVISDPVQLFEVSKNIKNAGVSVVEAISSDGVAYSATVPGIAELYAGLEVTIIPEMASASTSITLDVNGLGAKFVRLPLSNNTAILAQSDNESYFVDGRPVKLIYDPKYAGKGSWVVVGRQLYSGNDLYGTVPVENGGTGADNPDEARENLGAAPAGFGFGDASIATYHETGATDESKLDAWLNEQLASMADNTCRQVNITLRSILAGSDYFGTLFKGNGNTSAVLLATNYAGNTVVKTRNNYGTWGAIEFENPQMMTGVEYRTTERYQGKAVYCVALSSGSIPAKTKANINIESRGASEIVSVSIVNEKFDPEDMLASQWGFDAGHVSYGAATNSIYLFNNHDVAWSGVFILKFVKS